YIFINFNLIKIYVFINKSFANNKNLSLQIRFVLAIGSETEKSTGFTFFNNIIYTSFIKYKKITQAVLVSELYIIITRVDILIFLATIVNIITNKLGFLKLPIIVYTDFLFFYKYIIKLGIIKKTFDN
ncbi:hypothetical protein DL98DRAFT_642618, partial [Cadophora sp. DSE1049]